jgi:hypothetical protein
MLVTTDNVYKIEEGKELGNELDEWFRKFSPFALHLVL